MKNEIQFKRLREQIEEIDEKIFSSFGERVNMVKEIMKIKKENGIPVEDIEREEELIKRIKQRFNNLDDRFIEDVFRVVFHHSKRDK
ncbi:MAG: chorismate mutase [Nanoarchaeota archaeon]